ncbi:hypothetical protein [Vacuolonema iberomarrocanum]|uniref:hypothetical protein n=1 Tax=Vacuolonema iberomarrocanum TaxID=3454632 RepID=UPI003F6E3E65
MSWVKFFRPMLLISILLHGLVLMVPVSSEEVLEEEEVEEDVELEDEEMIGLSALQAPPPAPEPEPVATPTPAPNPTPAFTPIPQANPAPAPQPTPEPEPSPEPTPEATPTPDETEFAAGGGEEEDPTGSLEDVGEEVAASRNDLVSSLGAMPGVLAFGPDSGYFVESAPENYFTVSEFDDSKDDSIWRPGVIGVDWYNQGTALRAEEVISRLGNQFRESGAVMEEIPEGYGDVPLFRIAKDGQDLLFLSVVPSAGNSSTVVVQWDRNPNLPPENPGGV